MHYLLFYYWLFNIYFLLLIILIQKLLFYYFIIIYHLSFDFWIFTIYFIFIYIYYLVVYNYFLNIKFDYGNPNLYKTHSFSNINYKFLQEKSHSNQGIEGGSSYLVKETIKLIFINCYFSSERLLSMAQCEHRTHKKPRPRLQVEHKIKCKDPLPIKFCREQ